MVFIKSSFHNHDHGFNQVCARCCCGWSILFTQTFFCNRWCKVFLPPLQIQKVPSSSINWLFFSQVSVWQDLVSAPLCLLRLHLLLSSGRGGGAATGLVAIFTSILFFYFASCIALTNMTSIYIHLENLHGSMSRLWLASAVLALYAGWPLLQRPRNTQGFFNFL